MAEVTRADLLDAVHREIGLPYREAAELVETMIEAISERLVAGQAAKMSSFGSFGLRDKGPCVGRNPRTGEAASLSARRVVVFRAWTLLKKRLSTGIPRTE